MIQDIIMSDTKHAQPLFVQKCRSFRVLLLSSVMTHPVKFDNQLGE